jgi:selenocysteine lyase/cysteine desulfurase
MYKQFLDANIYKSPEGILMADQTSSSYPLKCVEEYIQNEVYPYYTNTHSNNKLGKLMVTLIDEAKQIIMKSVNGDCDSYKILFTGSGATGAINHLIHLIRNNIHKNTVIFVSSYEHYSNYLPWYHLFNKEYLSFEILELTNQGTIDLQYFREKLLEYKQYNIVASISACSNVTGVLTDIVSVSNLVKGYGGLIFYDYAASAPYTVINMTLADAIFISPHKFPGGMGTPGILIVKKDLICNTIPYNPGGGTVKYIDSKGPVYSTEIETKESGGTPNIIGIIKCGLVFGIKDHFISEIIEHKLELTKTFQDKLINLQKECPNLIILNPIENLNRLPIFAIQLKKAGSGFYHYNFIIALLSDLFNITCRGGISCSSVLAEKLLKKERHSVDKSEFGWVRITLDCMHTNTDLDNIINALKYICTNAEKHISEYTFNESTNLYTLITN